MFNLEFALRVIILLASLVLISLFYRFLGKKVTHFFELREANFIINFLSIILGVITLFVFFFVYVYYGFGYQPDIYRTGHRGTNKVAFTFDDGPSEEFTLPILDILEENNVPATFFMVGSHVEKFPEVARKVAKQGHAIGNHTQNHRNLPTLSTIDLHKELVEATAIITETTGVYPSFMRPPRGMYDGRSRRLAKLLGQEIVLWSISTRDWRYGVTANYITRFVDTKVQGGDIILFHDSGALLRSEGGDRTATVQALPDVINIIRSKGLEIVALEELLHNAPAEAFPQIDRPE
ncbi:MAG TPA: polysaccharide deacetylase family protein [Natronincola sp.]|nr:polysaccharide deacetylase family protein [Natronincola sp.]